MLFNDGKGFGNETIDDDFLSELAKKDRNLFECFVVLREKYGTMKPGEKQKVDVPNHPF